MLTDKQLKALMTWAVDAAVVANNGAAWRIGKMKRSRAEMYEAFGFEEGSDGWPVAPTHPHTLPPAKHVCKCSMQDVHDYGPCGENCLSRADYEAKHEAVHTLLRHSRAEQKKGVIGLANAADIMRLWTELKAIMEPNAGVLSASLAKSPVDASLIESLIRWCGGIADDDLALIAEKGHTVSRPTFTLTGNHALAILAARARLK